MNLVRKLAKEERSAALEQLASRISAAIRDGASNGEDPFVKVKGMISQMIERLMKEVATDGTCVLRVLVSVSVCVCVRVCKGTQYMIPGGG